MCREWLSHFSEKANIIDFLQNSLSCGCPMDVFDHYLVRIIRGPLLDYVMMVIGDRLLVYLLPYDKNLLTPKHVHHMMDKGRYERDSKGLNRFRFVLVGVPGEQQAELAEEVGFLDDPKIHLHFVRSISDS